MTLLALIIALLGVRKAMVPSYLAECQWGMGYLANIQNRSFIKKTHPALGYGIYAAVPVIFGWYIQAGHPWLFVIIELLLAIILLFAALDYRHVEAALVPFLNRWRSHEWQSAYEHGSETFDYGKMVSPGELLNQTVVQYWLKMNQTLFAPLFWYALFGIAGLALYLMTRLLKKDSLRLNYFEVPAWQKIGIEFLHTLDGIPARAIALTIAALTFNGKVVAVAVRRFRSTDREAEVVLKLAVKLGLNFQELPVDEEEIANEGLRRVRAMQDLRGNVLIFWLVVISVLTIVA